MYRCTYSMSCEDVCPIKKREPKQQTKEPGHYTTLERYYRQTHAKSSRNRFTYIFPPLSLGFNRNDVNAFPPEHMATQQHNNAATQQHNNAPTTKDTSANKPCAGRAQTNRGCTLCHNVCSAQCLGVHQHFVVKIPQPPAFFDGPTFPNEMQIDLWRES